MNIIGIIPARYNSSRLPGKPLADINGISMIMRVYQQAKKADLAEVIVATDDQRIYDHVIAHGGTAVMTSADHPSGTDRCLEAALQCSPLPDAIINIQGDEPFIEPSVIDSLAALLRQKEVNICTLVKAAESEEEVQNPNRVKVVRGTDGRGLYFSRSAIPFRRNNDLDMPTWLHIGIYGYKLDTLKEITSLDPSSLELTESLEQLRWLENGYTVHTAETKEESFGIDTPEDLEKANKYAKDSRL